MSTPASKILASLTENTTTMDLAPIVVGAASGALMNFRTKKTKQTALKLRKPSKTKLESMASSLVDKLIEEA